MSKTYSAGRFDTIVDGSITEIESNASSVGQYAFNGCTSLTSAKFPRATSVGGYAFQGCTTLESVSIPNVTDLGGFAFNSCSKLKNFKAPNLTYIDNNTLSNCPTLQCLVLPKVDTLYTSGIAGCSSLQAIDLRNGNLVRNGIFSKCSVLSTIIIRNTSAVATLSYSATFDQTPFASGGSGGTIYIPKVFYDQLGTGTNDYLANANWATIDGYGTITWAPIEGSEYENYYADGTPVE